MTISDSFVERLRKTFDGRLRVRWSVKEREYRIEQRVGRAAPIPIFIEADRDDLICAQDGYDYVLSIRPGDRMPCPVCHWTELRVPVRDFAKLTCEYCEAKGHKANVTAGYWPLDDSLIDHLRMLDPHRGAQLDLARAIDERNALREEREIDSAIDQGHAGASDHYNNLVGIEQVGYTGKVFNG
jgi:hypothetical protein